MGHNFLRSFFIVKFYNKSMQFNKIDSIEILKTDHPVKIHLNPVSFRNQCRSYLFCYRWKKNESGLQVNDRRVISLILKLGNWFLLLNLKITSQRRNYVNPKNFIWRFAHKLKFNFHCWNLIIFVTSSYISRRLRAFNDGHDYIILLFWFDVHGAQPNKYDA